MPLIHPDQWLPVGVDSLEAAAEAAVRSDWNALVVAGPGAGKTELLAQRACFLLDTGTCPAPRRILAISFKRDAARNLGDRVQQRCGDRAKRFDSFTLDAFAKSLVDRFMPALSADWRPKAGYEVMVKSLRPGDMREWIQAAGAPPGQTPIDLHQLSDTDIRRTFDRLCHGFRLPYDGDEVKPFAAHLGLRWWREQLSVPEGTPSLTFPMLCRLAAFLLRQNPRLTYALRATYGFVFLDEFQDTTAAQYDLVQAAFHGSTAVLTAVGDRKQRIMVWAGAMVEVFEAYQADFGAKLHHLVSNYRSAPELVRMQHVIAQALETGTPPAKAARTGLSGGCVVLEFSNPEEEAAHVAAMIGRGVGEGMGPRDFCILVRQRTAEMIGPLKTELGKQGIRLRDESELQDLLAEPVVEFLLAVLRLATRPRDAEAWELLTSRIMMLLGTDDGDDGTMVERQSRLLVEHARAGMALDHSNPALPAELVGLLGADVFRAAHRQYRSGSFLDDVLGRLAKALQTSAGICASAREAVDDLIGANVVPAMTIHKSKGLEFHTVIFLGLEDSQWWGFANQPDEEKRGFFVAFSRAAERVFFTFSDLRDGRWRREPQARDGIGDLYAILQKAGVPTEDLRL